MLHAAMPSHLGNMGWAEGGGIGREREWEEQVGRRERGSTGQGREGDHTVVKKY